jgi:cardiolipin synthase
LDSLGCLRSNGRFVAPLLRAGGQVGHFLPVLPLRRKWSANLRNHRKMVIVDGTQAMVGGMNLSTTFMGPTPRPDRFLDSAVFLRGPAVADIEDVFASDWNYATDAAPPEERGPVAHAESCPAAPTCPRTRCTTRCLPRAWTRANASGWPPRISCPTNRC